MFLLHYCKMKKIVSGSVLTWQLYVFSFCVFIIMDGLNMLYCSFNMKVLVFVCFNMYLFGSNFLGFSWGSVQPCLFCVILPPVFSSIKWMSDTLPQLSEAFFLFQLYAFYWIRTYKFVDFPCLGCMNLLMSPWKAFKIMVPVFSQCLTCKFCWLFCFW